MKAACIIGGITILVLIWVDHNRRAGVYWSTSSRLCENSILDCRDRARIISDVFREFRAYE